MHFTAIFVYRIQQKEKPVVWCNLIANILFFLLFILLMLHCAMVRNVTDPVNALLLWPSTRMIEIGAHYNVDKALFRQLLPRQFAEGAERIYFLPSKSIHADWIHNFEYFMIGNRIKYRILKIFFTAVEFHCCCYWGSWVLCKPKSLL